MEKKYTNSIIAIILFFTLMFQASGQNVNWSYKRLTIDKNTEIVQELIIIENITVKGNATLTVKSKLLMQPKSKIVIERGAKLIIDGGTLTNAGTGLWQGIEVWGNKNQSQSYTYQGAVEIINGGTVENAVCGISTIKMVDNTVPPPQDATPDYTYTGGLVLCDGGIFKNNRTAVKFWPYSYSSSASLFRNCQFITNDDMLDGTNPENFIEMSDISGVHILGGSFTDSHTVSNPDELTTGIEAYDARFYVWSYSGQPSLFSGLYYGIKAFALNPLETADILNGHFTNNFRGIYISGMTNAKLTGNNFSINSPFSIFNGGYGLYLHNSTAYTIEENNFYHEEGEPVGVGLIVHNSGGNTNEVYRNWFTNLKQGLSCQEQNRGTNDPAPGLQILCNVFNECTYDVLVPMPSLSSYGVAPKQGIDGNDVTDMAGNLFFYNTIPDDYDDLNNEGAYFEYFYPQNPAFGYERTKPEDYTTKTVKIQPKEIFPLQWTFDEGCPPSETGGGGGGPGRDEMRSSMNSAEQEITATEATLTLLVDGGDTEALNTEVETSIPPETVEVYNELMNGSPYLSGTVVASSIEKENVLPNAMIRDVMVANPHTSKSDVLMEKLDERLTPLPEYMKAQILEGRNLTSLKEELESQLAGYKLKKARAFNGLVRSFTNESETWQEASDSLLVLYQQDNDLQSKYRLAFLHLERGEYQLGENVLDNIPTQYGLEAELLANHQNMESYYSLIREIKEAGKSMMEADESQIQELQVIETSETGVASIWARDLLVALGEITYEEPIQMPDLLKSAEAIEAYEKLLNTKPPQMLEVYPNPSKDYVILGYKLEVEQEGTIEIQDVTGKSIKVILTNSMQDQITVVTKGCKPGVYIATFKIDGKTIESVKFTLVK